VGNASIYLLHTNLIYHINLRVTRITREYAKVENELGTTKQGGFLSACLNPNFSSCRHTDMARSSG